MQAGEPAAVHARPTGMTRVLLLAIGCGLVTACAGTGPAGDTIAQSSAEPVAPPTAGESSPPPENDVDQRPDGQPVLFVVDAVAMDRRSVDIVTGLDGCNVSVTTEVRETSGGITIIASAGPGDADGVCPAILDVARMTVRLERPLLENEQVFGACEPSSEDPAGRQCANLQAFAELPAPTPES